MRWTRANGAMGGAAVLALAAGLVQAATIEVRGRWERAGAGYACTHINRPPTPADCYYIGPLTIGLDSAQPGRSPPERRDPSRVFPRRRPAVALCVATVLNDRVMALQLTGASPYHKLNFNGVALGTAAEKVTATFGEPKSVQPGHHAGTELWSYTPWTFSFEVTAGQVTSVRVADPSYR
jgi:hypothetical protein